MRRRAVRHRAVSSPGSRPRPRCRPRRGCRCRCRDQRRCRCRRPRPGRCRPPRGFPSRCRSGCRRRRIRPSCPPRPARRDFHPSCRSPGCLPCPASSGFRTFRLSIRRRPRCRRRRRAGVGPWSAGRCGGGQVRRGRAWRRRTRQAPGPWVSWAADPRAPLTGSRRPVTGVRPPPDPRRPPHARGRPADRPAGRSGGRPVIRPVRRPAGRPPTAVSRGTWTRMPSSRRRTGRCRGPREAVRGTATPRPHRTGTGTSPSFPDRRPSRLEGPPSRAALPVGRRGVSPAQRSASGRIQIAAPWRPSRALPVLPSPCRRSVVPSSRRTIAPPNHRATEPPPNHRPTHRLREGVGARTAGSLSVRPAQPSRSGRDGPHWGGGRSALSP